MKLSELLLAAGLCPDCIPDREILSVTSDASRVMNGGLYVCHRREPAEVEALCAQARRNGAAAAASMMPCSGADILCADSRGFVAAACSELYGRPQDRLRMIGVTGTNGKTTVASVITHILTALGHKCSLIGTNGSSGYTTPVPELFFPALSDAVSKGCEFLVTEVSSHSLDQQRVSPVRFECGVFTNLTRDHLDYHGTMEKYAQAKRKLFMLCGTGIINRDDPHYELMTSACRKFLLYGINAEADFTARDIEQSSSGVSYTLGGERVFFPVPGLFSVSNSLAAISACVSLGFDLGEVCRALSGFGGVDGRMERLVANSDFDVIIDYAHTPDGLENVMKTVNAYKKGRLIVLFGAGGERDKGKRALMCAACAKYADYIVITSDNPRRENPFAIIKDILSGLNGYETPFAVVENRAAATEFAINQACSGDIVLLAGKGHERYQICVDGRIPYDEREVVRDILFRRNKEIRG